jgi:hypothetical protein
MNQMNGKNESLISLKKQGDYLKKNKIEMDREMKEKRDRERNGVQKSEEEETKEFEIAIEESGKAIEEPEKDERLINLSHLDRHLFVYFNLYLIIIYLVIKLCLIFF